MRRDLLDLVGGVPRQSLMDDAELCKRLRRLGSPRCTRRYLMTSARRWQRDGIAPTILLMWRLRLRYFLGADPRRLAAEYYGA